MKKSIRNLILLFLICLIIFLTIYLLIPKAEKEETSFNALLLLGSGVERPLEVYDHQVIEHTGYVLSYNEEYEVADWVAYEFTNKELNTNVAQRKDNFREDKDVLTGSAQLSDYKKSGYSRGHLAPAADFKWSDEAMSDTFLLSNMTPQKQDHFNAGIWLKAEDFVRSVCSDNTVVFVATGPVLTDGPYETIGKNHVAVPKQFYKVLLAVSEDGELTSYAMIIPHDAQRSENLSKYMCSIDDVENITGLDFFYRLEDSIELEVEKSVSSYEKYL